MIGGLQGVEAEIAADERCDSISASSRGREARGASPPARRLSDGHQAAVAGGAEVLRGEEAEAAVVAHRARPPPLVLGADGLGGVLNHDQAATPGDVQDRVHLGALAVEVDGNDRLRARRNAALDLRGVDVVRVRQDVHEDGNGAERG